MRMLLLAALLLAVASAAPAERFYLLSQMEYGQFGPPLSSNPQTNRETLRLTEGAWLVVDMPDDKIADKTNLVAFASMMRETFDRAKLYKVMNQPSSQPEEELLKREVVKPSGDHTVYADTNTPRFAEILYMLDQIEPGISRQFLPQIVRQTNAVPAAPQQIDKPMPADLNKQSPTFEENYEKFKVEQRAEDLKQKTSEEKKATPGDGVGKER